MQYGNRQENCFSRQQRLLAPRQFKHVFGTGKASKDRCFVVIAAGRDQPVPRLGLAISKRRARRAVDRNRIKRVVRESFRQQGEALHGLDIVVLAQRQTKDADNRRLFDSLNRHWHRLRAARQTREQDA